MERTPVGIRHSGPEYYIFQEGHLQPVEAPSWYMEVASLGHWRETLGWQLLANTGGAVEVRVWGPPQPGMLTEFCVEAPIIAVYIPDVGDWGRFRKKFVLMWARKAREFSAYRKQHRLL